MRSAGSGEGSCTVTWLLGIIAKASPRTPDCLSLGRLSLRAEVFTAARDGCCCYCQAFPSGKSSFYL